MFAIYSAFARITYILVSIILIGYAYLCMNLLPVSEKIGTVS